MTGRRVIGCWRRFANMRSIACGKRTRKRAGGTATLLGSFRLPTSRGRHPAIRTRPRGSIGSRGELDNLRAALGWAIEQKLPDALRIAVRLFRWWRAHVTEAREWFSRLLDVVPRDQARRDRANALDVVGNLALSQRDHDEAERLFRESLALFREIDDARGSANVQTSLAVWHCCRGGTRRRNRFCWKV